MGANPTTPAEKPPQDAAPPPSITPPELETIDAGEPGPEPADELDGGTPEPEPEPEPARCAEDEELGPGEHCYAFVAQTVTWPEARKECQDRGDHWDLASIDSEAEHLWLSARVPDEMWLGGQVQNREWFWVNSETVFWRGGPRIMGGQPVGGLYSAWEPMEPNTRTGRACLRLNDQLGGWYFADTSCSNSLGSLCEQTRPQQ